MKHRLFWVMICLLPISSVWACTSIIVSGKATRDGKPVMLKHRDTDCLDNRVEYFQGTRYRFIGLTNKRPTRPYAWAEYTGGEVWSGVNEAGFCIMNTADYNLKNDAVSVDSMDCEGLLMYEALSVCATVEDFDRFLANHARPMRVEANFGVIDAMGGAAYFEVNNDSYWQYDVNQEPSGYRVQTNFAFAGRETQREGVERYQTASAIMRAYEQTHEMGTYELKHNFFISHFSRSYRHELLGLRENDCPPSGIVVDQDFIPRHSTSATIVFEGVTPNEDPQKTVMWTALGYPATAMMIPLMVGKENVLPTFVMPGIEDSTADWCTYSQKLKNTYLFPFSVSNGKKYLRLDVVLRGEAGKPSMKTCAQKAEQLVDSTFIEIWNVWNQGGSEHTFYQQYRALFPVWNATYKKCFSAYPVP